ncbi:MAG: DUF1294 domain-containing protein [Roseivivax sp.]|nr:DUF1294 domain-containing protein [Roseivivax sp.]
MFALNVLTYAAFARDKRRARKGGRRVPERTLLGLALVGGWPAAKLAQHWLRHKTYKQPFAVYLNLVPVVWAVAALAVWLV